MVWKPTPTVFTCISVIISELLANDEIMLKYDYEWNRTGKANIEEN